MFAKYHSRTDTRDFSRFLGPIASIPERVEAAIARGVQSGTDHPLNEAAKLIEPAGDGLVDAVKRNSDGVLVVACLTEMPGVTPEMWDWWFGWHGLSTERYKLWHPKDHLWSALTEDRSHMRDARMRYVGNTSYVDERIGSKETQQLSIAFKSPQSFGFDQGRLASVGTAICARVGFRPMRADSGHLVHVVRRTPQGAEMLSRFWLGNVRSRLPLIGPLISRQMNRKATRLRLVPDSVGLNLLRHCSEEMNHLARILPALHDEFGLD